nr:MAG TPA: hypothetical protein [Caudoviricetes sp.]
MCIQKIKRNTSCNASKLFPSTVIGGTPSFINNNEFGVTFILYDGNNKFKTFKMLAFLSFVSSYNIIVINI